MTLGFLWLQELLQASWCFLRSFCFARIRLDLLGGQVLHHDCIMASTGSIGWQNVGYWASGRPVVNASSCLLRAVCCVCGPLLTRPSSTWRVLRSFPLVLPCFDSLRVTVSSTWLALWHLRPFPLIFPLVTDPVTSGCLVRLQAIVVLCSHSAHPDLVWSWVARHFGIPWRRVACPREKAYHQGLVPAH